MGVRELTSKFDSLLARVLGHSPSMKERIPYALGWFKDFIIYGTTFTDYFEIGFYSLKPSEKETYLTQRFAHKFAFSVDTEESINAHNSKVLEYQKLKPFFKRDQLSATDCSFEEFAAFTSKHPTFLYKPDQNDCGKGIQKITVTPETDLHDLYAQLTQSAAVLDELVIQHPSLEQLSPGSVNTIRIISLKVGSEVHLLAAAIRTGNGKDPVDNFAMGGVAGAVDLATGTIIADGVDHSNRTYALHPVSQIPLKGFQIPLWDEVTQLVKDAGQAYDHNYIGWDIAVREKDCVVIEANPRPMIQLFQVAGNGGKKKVFKEAYKLYQSQERQDH